MSGHAAANEAPKPASKTKESKESSVIGTTVSDAIGSIRDAFSKVVLQDIPEPARALREGHVGRAAVETLRSSIGKSLLHTIEGIAGTTGALLGVGYEKKTAKEGFDGVVETPGKLWKNTISPYTAFREGHGALGKIGKALWAFPKDVLWGNLRDLIKGIGNFLKPITGFKLRSDAGITGLIYSALVSLKEATAPKAEEKPTPAAPAPKAAAPTTPPTPAQGAH
ncbi:MAG: hypothetical protein ACD_51C00313G0002 [uncultured bacterium]|nr:MAG: hypothetical protein ACD_51C00313G0002 [uncultured bacterium]OGJ47046.1 MAG: hypothetical protein A2244_04890 [Candidatus Peregrinibacteria bacterium RIFOXYA2_FULL_41_18]OGJ49734.1 MAG: hypothetical protein A2344_03550 [Candidatus Peregrinibacteria bacterium RIFOXYB12_FULL_41_12]OGJ53513.1 MAG: hypothetical protein A2448_01575 [Candidatus Peregrinibacteria bacterium RIFOXYC2_FULL_41_22]OGJ53728.1 MAG: hypothetical protein A2336_04000 [Candidatus Peregrinibacteria bacterium RIFOXYB2_FULL